LISTIIGTIAVEVTPGSGSFAASLTIANTGVIDSQPTAISANVFGADITNLGSIDGNVSFFLDDALSNAGHIAGVTAVSFTFSDTATNTGQIVGQHVGIYLGEFSRVSNSGLIQGGYVGVDAPFGGYILNTGTIQQVTGAGGPVQLGVDLTGGTLNNKNLISGLYGVDAQNGSTVINSGIIHGQNIGLIGVGSDLISNTGDIGGYFTGINAGSGTITNTGSITGIDTGIAASSTEQIINSGHIYGGTAIGLASGGEVTNAGIIFGNNFAIHNSNTSLALTLTVDAGASFTGIVEDQSNHGTLILTGTAASVLNMGTSFSGFSQIDFNPAVKWTLEGSTLELAHGQTINGFGPKSTIVLDNFSTSSYTFISGTGLIISNGVTNETLDIVGSLTTAEFDVFNIGGNSVIDPEIPCFCAGTRIATKNGNIPVESLNVGDLVKTATHGFLPIRWIGRRDYDGRFIAGNHLALPVRIRRGAFAHNVPSRDLYVSPEHALCEGGVLVHAWRFINGVSITQAQSVAQVEYYHIELDCHAVIFAENTPVESFLDTGCRNRFQNAASAPQMAPQKPCLPRVEDGYYLAQLKARIDERAKIRPAGAIPGPLRGNIDEAGPVLSGWAQDAAAPEIPVELELLSGGQIMRRFLANRYRADLRQARLGSGCHAFEMALPPLPGPFALRRVADGAVLGEDQGWMPIRRAG
jgi:hypothetical protein